MPSTCLKLPYFSDHLEEQPEAGSGLAASEEVASG